MIAELQVARKERVASDVVCLTLVHPQGHTLPRWTPGAHVSILVAPGVVRQYSLCGDLDDDRSWQVAVLREQGGAASCHLHDVVEQGGLIRVQGPRNDFTLVPADRYVFIAGGIGITPLLPMLQAASAAGTDWSLLYGGRQLTSMAFLDRLAADGSRVTVWPQDQRGLLPLPTLLARPAPGTAVYCCGPEPLLQAVVRASEHWPAGAVHLERFRARTEPDDQSFEVVLERSGLALTVPADRSVLEVVEQAGVEVLSSCRTGTCGTCETAVLRGTPDHRDAFLSDEERACSQTVLLCVSRSRTPTLVLDL